METNNEPIVGNEGTPEVGSADIPAGEGTTPGGLPQAESFDKIDPSKLTPEQLKYYKFFQGHYTRATQRYSEQEKGLSAKLQEYEQKLKSTSPLLEDDLIKPLAYYRQYGRFPDGFDPAPYAKILGIEQTDPNAPYVDPTMQTYLQSEIARAIGPLKQQNDFLQANYQKEIVGKVENTVKDYEAELGKQDPKLAELFNTYKNNGMLADALKKTPFSPNHKERLEFAFNGLAAKEYVPYVKEKARNQVLEELKAKSNKDRPMQNGSLGNVTKVNSKNLKDILSDEFDKVMGG